MKILPGTILMYWILLSLRQTFGKARLPTHTNLPLLGADCRVARWGCAVQFCGGTSRVFGQGHPPLPLRVPIYHLPTHTCHPISLSLPPFSALSPPPLLPTTTPLLAAALPTKKTCSPNSPIYSGGFAQFVNSGARFVSPTPRSGPPICSV
jgi:hypothetical protein